MTCIVGVRTENGVLLAGDTLASAGHDARVRRDDKVFRLNREVACGFTSSYRMGQILRFHVTAPLIGRDEYAWAVRDFIPAVRAAFKTHGYAHVECSVESGGTFVLAVRRRLFLVHNDFQVGEAAEDYTACGCGESYALGAFRALEGAKLAPRARARRALEVASHFSNGVGGPFTFVETRAT